MNFLQSCEWPLAGGKLKRLRVTTNRGTAGLDDILTETHIDQMWPILAKRDGAPQKHRFGTGIPVEYPSVSPLFIGEKYKFAYFVLSPFSHTYGGVVKVC